MDVLLSEGHGQAREMCCHRSLMKFNRDKCKVMYLRKNKLVMYLRIAAVLYI